MTASGPLTAKLTWKPAYPGEPPPASVILCQDCRAALTVNRYYGICGASSICSDGLGGSAALPFSGTQATTESYKYSVGAVAADGTVSVSCSPNAVYSMSCSPGVGSYASGGASISYTVTVYPVIVTLGGTTKDSSGGDNILIGQGCTPGISAGPCTLSNFSWNPGGAMFDQFQVASDQSTGKVIPVSSDQWQKPNPHWHYLQDSSQSVFTVTCSATASINGSAIGTITAQRKVQVWVPYYFMGANVNPCTIVGDLIQAGGPNTESQLGISFTGRVGTPALFRGGGGISSSICGVWAFLQLCNLNEKLYSSVAPTLTNSTSGYELDNIWPFSIGGNANSTDTAPNSASTADSPGIAVNVFTDKVGVTDNFQMYLMYQPPGSDSQWVPLDQLTWHWYIDTTEVGSQWIPTPPGTVVADPDKRWMLHPEWTSRYTNTTGKL